MSRARRCPRPTARSRKGRARLPKTFGAHSKRRATYALPANRRMCYVFELTLPQHTIVVRHGRAGLTCLGGRDLDTLQEVGCEVVAAANGWAAAPRYDALRSLEAVRAAARALNPVEHAGFVVVDGGFGRLKVKSPAYVALHHMGGRALVLQCRRQPKDGARGGDGVVRHG